MALRQKLKIPILEVKDQSRQKGSDKPVKGNEAPKREQGADSGARHLKIAIGPWVLNGGRIAIT